ncbi:MAG: 6-pyruvoyl-tetrahydropterin synthase-related protein [Actinobacteria bacterium]|nr:6-pyruvoyl-tetrahydropterin synthase-related protein [Actinomycetota bacterium]
MRLREIACRLDPFLLLALLLVSFVLHPLLNPGLPGTSDGLLQPYRLVELDAALRSGTLYPRWAPDLWLGYGYPLFNFYAPLFYYLGEAFHIAGLDFESSVKAVVVMALLLASLSAYLLGRRFFGRLGGLLTAAAYLYTPHFLTEVYRRGDYPQLLGLALLPLILWSFGQLAVEGGRGRLVAAALSLAALLLTHTVTAMLFAPAFALWLLLLVAIAPGTRWAALGRLVAANLLALGASAFFWLPAIVERPLVQTDRLLTGHFDFRLHFVNLSTLLGPAPLTDPQLLNGPMSFSLGQPQVALAVLGLLGLAFLAMRRTLTSPPNPLSVCGEGEGSDVAPFSPLIEKEVGRGTHQIAGAVSWSALVALTAALMMLPISMPAWEGSAFLALAQFPWRWLGIAGLGIALLAGATMRLALARWPALARGALAAAALLFIVIGAFPMLYPVLPFDRYTDLTVADVTRFELGRGPMGTSSGSEFLPKWVKSAPGRSPMVEELLAGQSPTKVDLGALPPGVQARTLSHGPTWDEVEVDAPQSLGMLFRTLYFPGWVAYLDGRPIEVSPFETYGFALVAVPAGQHRVLLRFEDTPVRAAAQLISAACLLALAVILAWRWRRRNEKDAGPHGHVPLPAAGIAPLPTGGRVPLAPPSRAGENNAPGWGAAAALGLLLAVLLVAKVAFIDEHTGWFRQPVTMQDWADGPVELGRKIMLRGYSLQPEQPEPGQTWNITLYWQGVVPMQTNYKSFTHLLTPDEAKLVAQKDNEHPGQLPTSWWRQDKVVQDSHPLLVPADLPPGRYPLVAGMYDPQSGERLMPPGGGRSYVVIAWLQVP